MHEIRIILEDKEFERLEKVKGEKTWKELLVTRAIVKCPYCKQMFDSLVGMNLILKPEER